MPELETKYDTYVQGVQFLLINHLKYKKMIQREISWLKSHMMIFALYKINIDSVTIVILNIVSFFIFHCRIKIC